MKSLRFSELFFLTAALLQTCCAMSWRQCDSGPFTPTKVSLIPDPPKIGQDVSFDILGKYAPEDDKHIPQGTLDVSVAFMGSPIFQTQWDLCSKTSCPIAPGDLELHYSQTLPPIAPPGKYEVQLVAHDGDGGELLCLTVDFDIRPPSLTNILRSQQ